jgi:ABC-2 type transport system ATP-binding protein
MEPSMIEIQQLTKRYGPTLAVDDLTLTVRPGHVTGFLGPNGAGKSTTMRVVLGLDHPTSGRALVNGRAYRDLPAPLRTVGALLDAGEVHPRRTAAGHLRSLAATIGEGAGRVRTVLDMVGLGDTGHRRVGTFSLGMRQRLGVAAALIGDPEVVVLDEPVNGLDPEGVIWIRTFVRGLAAEGRTVLISSHLMSEMSQTADHLLVVGRGRLVADVPTETLLRGAEPAVRVVTPQVGTMAQLLESAGARITSRDGEELLLQGVGADTVGRLALDHRLALHQLVTQRRSLEEAYLELTHDSVDYRSRSAGSTPTHAPLAQEASL